MTFGNENVVKNEYIIIHNFVFWRLKGDGRIKNLMLGQISTYLFWNKRAVKINIRNSNGSLECQIYF